MHKLIFIILLLLIIFTSLYLTLFKGDFQQYIINLSQDKILANGVSTLQINVESKSHFNSFLKHSPDIDLKFITGENLLSLISINKLNNGKTLIELKSKLTPGEAKLKINIDNGKLEKIVSITLLPDFSDSDKDGFPNVVELTSEDDRKNFALWFSAIAEAQFYSIDPYWRVEDQECAGLLRFAYREALKVHSNEWLNRLNFATNITIPDIKKYNYPAVPILGVNIFRNKDGAFSPADTSDSTFATFSNAKHLQSYNTVFISKNINDAKKGDLLFYIQEDNPRMPFHSMIFIGDDNGTIEPDNDDWIVYHTGPTYNPDGSIKDKGTVKKVRWKVLCQHPDEKWHPIPENKKFLGFYRWKIIH